MSIGRPKFLTGYRYYGPLRMARAGFFILLQLLPSCTGWATMEQPATAAEHFRKASALFEAGRYREAIQEYRTVTVEFPNDDLAAESQYQVAFTEIYFKNAGTDYGIAAKDFQKLIQKYPDSPWKNPAQTWLNILNRLQTLNAENEKLKSDLQRLLDLDMQSEKKRRELK